MWQQRGANHQHSTNRSSSWNHKNHHNNHNKRKFHQTQRDVPQEESSNRQNMLIDPWKTVAAHQVATGVLPASELDKDFSFPSV